MLNSEPIIIKKYVEKAIFIGVIRQDDDEATVNEYLDELEFLAETAGVEKRGRFVLPPLEYIFSILLILNLIPFSHRT